MSSLTILYGTQTGNAERLAFRLARYALLGGCDAVQVFAADEVPVSSWVSLSPVLLVCANANQGEAPLTFRETWKTLVDPDAAPFLDGLFFAVFGVGDSLYEKFNYMAKMVHNRLLQLQATALVTRGLGDESDPRGLEEALEPWLRELWTVLGWGDIFQQQTTSSTLTANTTTPNSSSSPPTLGSLHALAKTQLPLFPLYQVSTVARDATTTSAAAFGSKHTCSASSCTTPMARQPSHFFCEVVQNTRLTAQDHFQAVHHIELRGTSGGFPAFEVGDALGIFVKNHKRQVDAALDLLRCTGEEVVVVEPYSGDGPLDIRVEKHTQRDFCAQGPLSVRTLLEDYVDLDAVVSQEFLWMLSRAAAEKWQVLTSRSRKVNAKGPLHCSPSHSPSGSAVVDPHQQSSRHTQAEEEMEIEAALEVWDRLLELSDPGKPDEYLNYAHREKRNVVEVMQDFKQLRVDLPLFLTFASPMRPRYFSLSSSPSADSQWSEAGGVCHLTVAKLAWATPMRRHREGLCSATLADAQPGSRFECCRWDGALVLPQIPLPLVCIATGSGIAPIRALLREWAAKADNDAHFRDVPVYLFFGCRNASKDFLYAQEWETLKSKSLPQLKVIAACSRDTPQKVYVQHQLGQYAKTIGALLADTERPPVVYICGNAKQMPRDVGRALLQIATEVSCSGDEEAAKRLMRAMNNEGRYQVDTWSS